MSRILHDLQKKRAMHDSMANEIRKSIDDLRFEIKRNEASLADEAATIAEIDLVISLYEAHLAPAQPVHPEAELRSVPGAEEKVRDQLLTAFEDDHIVERGPLIDAQTCEEVDPRVSWKADMVGATTGPWEPEIPAGFTKWEGGRRPIEIGTHIEAITADGKKSTWVTSDAIMDEQVNWELDGSELDIIAYRILSQAVETDQPEVPEIEETLPGDEADAESDALGDYGWRAQAEKERQADGWVPAAEFVYPKSEAIVEALWEDGYCERLTFAGYTPTTKEPTWRSVRADDVNYALVTHLRSYPLPTSVLNDPELQAAVDRANASIAQDEPKPYVGCIDEELERDYDAAKARTTIKHEDAKKPFFAFLGAKPKPETEPA